MRCSIGNGFGGKHYYPFGLTMAGISSKAANSLENNKNKFQNQELTTDLGIDIYEFKYRAHDLQTGRFWQVDPLAEKYVYNSTYAFSENKVVAHRELEGLEATLSTVAIIWENNGTATYIYGDNREVHPADQKYGSTGHLIKWTTFYTNGDYYQEDELISDPTEENATSLHFPQAFVFGSSTDGDYSVSGKWDDKAQHWTIDFGAISGGDDFKLLDLLSLLGTIPDRAGMETDLRKYLLDGYEKEFSFGKDIIDLNGNAANNGKAARKHYKKFYDGGDASREVDKNADKIIDPADPTKADTLFYKRKTRNLTPRFDDAGTPENPKE